MRSYLAGLQVDNLPHSESKGLVKGIRTLRNGEKRRFLGIDTSHVFVRILT